MSGERIYDQEREWDGKVNVTVNADFDTIEEAQRFATEAEDLINRMNGGFNEIEIEPA